MRFARWVFGLSGAYGLLVLVPQLFLEERFNRDYPPPITHPENFYGFLGVAIAWQFAFLVIASDPLRYRPMMLPTLIEKGSFAVAVAVLYARQRIPGVVFTLGMIDLMWGVLFFLAWLRLAAPEKHVHEPPPKV